MNVGYINPDVAAMYGIPLNELTPEQRKILKADGERRKKLIEDREKAVLLNNLKAFDDEAKMEKVLASLYKQCQKDILADVAETMAKVQKDGGTWSYANKSALTRDRGLFDQINKELGKLGIQEQAVFTDGLSHIYTDQFKRTVYTLGQSITVSTDFAKLNPELVKKTLDYPWSGAMFSDRLWNDKATLGRNLRTGLTQSMILGESMPKISKRIGKNIDTSESNAMRIARTETKRVCYVAQDDVFEDCGVGKVKYMCANSIKGNHGDDRVCKFCRKFDGVVFKRGEEPQLPQHPNCRCWYVPEVSDTFGDNELNELTGSIRGAENFEKWEAEHRKKENISEDDLYVKAIDEITARQKLIESDIVATQSSYDDVMNQYNSYSSVRRGLLNPDEAGFKSKADFKAKDTELYQQAQDLSQKLGGLRDDLHDAGMDLGYVTGNDYGKIYGVKHLKEFQNMRKSLRNNPTFDYVKYRDEFTKIAGRMDEDALVINNALAKITENNIYNDPDPKTGLYSKLERRVKMNMSDNKKEIALGNGFKGAWTDKYHEEGHQLDHLLAGEVDIGGNPINGAGINYMYAFTSASNETGKAFSEAIEKDLLDVVNLAIKEYNTANANVAGFKKVKDLTDFKNISKEVKDAFTKYINNLTNNGKDQKTKRYLGLLTDAIGLYTKNKMSGKSLGYACWGHPSAYNKKRDGDGATSETWASFCSLRTCGESENIAFAKKLMPTTWAKMDSVFHRIAEYVKKNKLSY